MRVLIACEYSGIVREAFKAKGHDATSCDILPTEIPGKHYQGDVLDILNDGWDLMIAHPPCTYLSSAGNGFFNEEVWGEKARERKRKREKAKAFFLLLLNSRIEKICVENVRGYMSRFLKPTQIIEPYYFGDEYVKQTHLWLKNLPKLIHLPVNDLFQDKTHALRPPPDSISPNGMKRYFTDTKRNPKVRSRTFPGIANAMADQWG